MRTFDFAPLSRSTIGFERLFDQLNNLQRADPGDTYPPYDILRLGEDAFRIRLAVAGFSPAELSIVAQQNLVTVTGRKPENGKHEYLYQGISARPFERRFSLADHVEVAGASYEHGLLQIDLVRRLPEAMKPRRIEIGNVTTLPKRDRAKPTEAEQAA
jgi:molecular chaperone IbpA